jgi:hypothetical protein
MISKWRIVSITIVAMALLNSGCAPDPVQMPSLEPTESSAPSVPTDTPPTSSPTDIPPSATLEASSPQVGRWSGSNPLPVSFEVKDDGTIVDLSLTVNLFGSQCQITAEETVLEENGSFTIVTEMENEGTTRTNTITGKFEGSDTVSGTADIWFCGLPDGGVLLMDFAPPPAEWTAAPEN